MRVAAYQIIDNIQVKAANVLYVTSCFTSKSPQQQQLQHPCVFCYFSRLRGAHCKHYDYIKSADAKDSRFVEPRHRRVSDLRREEMTTDGGGIWRPLQKRMILFILKDFSVGDVAFGAAIEDTEAVFVIKRKIHYRKTATVGWRRSSIHYLRTKDVKVSSYIQSFISRFD